MRESWSARLIAAVVRPGAPVGPHTATTEPRRSVASPSNPSSDALGPPASIPAVWSVQGDGFAATSAAPGLLTARDNPRSAPSTPEGPAADRQPLGPDGL